MKSNQRNYYDAFKRVKQNGIDYPLLPAVAEATTAYTGLGGVITSIETIDSNRLNGHNTWLAASSERQFRRDALRGMVSDLSRIAKSLDKIEYPDVAKQLKIGRAGSYAAVTALATNAIDVITPIKEVFVGYGAPATVIEDLQGAITALQNAGGRGYSGRGKRIGKNVELEVALRKGREYVRVLDGILSMVYKDNPPMLAEWKAAKRVRRKLPAEQPAPAAPAAPAPQPAA